MSSNGGAGGGKADAEPKLDEAAVPAMDGPAPTAAKGQASDDSKPKNQLTPYRIQPEQAPKIPKLTMAPLLYFKVLHLIRHAEGFHNAAAQRDGTGYVSWDYEDAQLTAKGWKQAQALNAHLRATGVKVDLIVVSPLTRTLQTAAVAFGDWQTPAAAAAVAPAIQPQQQQQPPAAAQAVFPFGGLPAANQQQQQPGGFVLGQKPKKQQAAGVRPGAPAAGGHQDAGAAAADSHRHPTASTGGVAGAGAAVDHQVGQAQPLAGPFGPFQPKEGPVWGQGHGPAAAPPPPPAAAAAAQGPQVPLHTGAGAAAKPAAVAGDSQAAAGAKTGDAAGAAGSQRQVLMREVVGMEGRASPHPTVYMVPGCAPMYANELCREVLETCPCDRRHMLSTKREAFPGVIFEPHLANEDPMWCSSHPETWEQAVARARTFLMQLLNRPETHIAVVSHGNFLGALTDALGSEVPKEGAKYMRRHMMNAELRSVVVTTWGTAGTGRPNTDYVPQV